MNCLFCGKRLSIFHGKKKPYCSAVHEDRYLERQARTALDRLQDQSIQGPPKLPDLFSQEKVATAISDEAPGFASTFHRQAEVPEFSDPPAAEYLTGDPNGIQTALPFRDLGAAAFPEEAWEVTPVLQSSRALLGLSDSQIGPGLVTFPQVTEEPQLETPSQVTVLTPLEIRPVALFETTATRVFCEPSLVIAVPGLALIVRRRTLAPVTDRAKTASSEPGVYESLPSPQPLRFRTVLDLHNPVFQTAKRRIAPAGQVPLAWNAIPPESVLWQSKLTRRTVAPVLPRLTGGVARLTGGTGR